LNQTAESCAATCARTAGCYYANFQPYQCGHGEAVAPGACYLLGAGCEHEENTCWDLYVAPGPPAFRIKKYRTGCSNWKTLAIKEHFKVDNMFQCAEECRQVSCSEFNFAPREGDCHVLNGSCVQESNSEYDLYELMNQGKTALLVIDVQDCFLNASTTSGQPGSLAVPASHLIPIINELREKKGCLFQEVVWSQDFHPANHISFGSTHGLAPFSHLAGKGELPITCLKPTSGMVKDAACCPTIHLNPSAVDCNTQLCPPADFSYADNNSAFVTDNHACSVCKSEPDRCFQTSQAMWTDHCRDTGDSGFPPSVDKRSTDLVVKKGVMRDVDAYSAFLDNTKSLKTKLDDLLKSEGVTDLYVVGIATDYCVQQSVTDAIDLGYTVKVVKDATAAVMGNQTNFLAALDVMEKHGATIMSDADVLATTCPQVR
jgi:nicotinamidase-related amidase